MTKPKSKEELFAVISRFGQTREGDLALSDCAFWPVVEEGWKGRKQSQCTHKRISIDQIVSMPASES